MVASLIRAVIAAEWLAALAIAGWLVWAKDWPTWLAALIAIAVPALMHGSVIGLQSLTGARQRRRFAAGAMAESSAPAKPTPAGPRASALVAIRAWLGETRASLRSFMLLMPWYGVRALPSGEDCARLPVVLVHGYFCNRAIWRPMAMRLAARGHALEAPNLEPPLADIDSYVPAVEAAVERLRARTGAERVALVGHSMGGLVIRAWLRQHGADRVAAVVTLGSPHQGTWSARHALGQNVSQMREGSAWLAELARSETPALRRLFTVIVTLHDNIVMPQVAQSLADARTHVLSGIGHVALVQEPSVYDFVFDAVDRAQDQLERDVQPDSESDSESGATASRAPDKLEAARGGFVSEAA